MIVKEQIGLIPHISRKLTLEAPIFANDRGHEFRHFPEMCRFGSRWLSTGVQRKGLARTPDDVMN